jgi:hypothetical protein
MVEEVVFYCEHVGVGGVVVENKHCFGALEGVLSAETRPERDG